MSPGSDLAPHWSPLSKPHKEVTVELQWPLSRRRKENSNLSVPGLPKRTRETEGTVHDVVRVLCRNGNSDLESVRATRMVLRLDSRPCTYRIVSYCIGSVWYDEWNFLFESFLYLNIFIFFSFRESLRDEGTLQVPSLKFFVFILITGSLCKNTYTHFLPILFRNKLKEDWRVC